MDSPFLNRILASKELEDNIYDIAKQNPTRVLYAVMVEPNGIADAARCVAICTTEKYALDLYRWIASIKGAELAGIIDFRSKLRSVTLSYGELDTYGMLNGFQERLSKLN